MGSGEPMSSDVHTLLAPLRRMQERVRDAVVAACERSSLEALSRVDDETSDGDTIYAVDRVSEELLIEIFEQEIAAIAPLVLIGEGLAGGHIVLPRDTR